MSQNIINSPSRNWGINWIYLFWKHRFSHRPSCTAIQAHGVMKSNTLHLITNQRAQLLNSKDMSMTPGQQDSNPLAVQGDPSSLLCHWVAYWLLYCAEPQRWTENPPVAALHPVKRGKSLGSGRYSKHSFHLLITFPPLMTPISSSYRKAWAWFVLSLSLQMILQNLFKAQVSSLVIFPNHGEEKWIKPDTNNAPLKGLCH